MFKSVRNICSYFCVYIITPGPKYWFFCLYLFLGYYKTCKGEPYRYYEEINNILLIIFSVILIKWAFFCIEATSSAWLQHRDWCFSITRINIFNTEPCVKTLGSGVTALKPKTIKREQCLECFIWEDPESFNQGWLILILLNLLFLNHLRDWKLSGTCLFSVLDCRWLNVKFSHA